jgi:hypothetical protein
MTKLSMSVNQFRVLVAPVVPFVARQSAVHVLEGVRVRTEQDRVVAEAVSGTMLGMCVRPMPGVVPGFDVVFPIDDLPVSNLDSDATIELEQTGKGTVIIAWSHRSALAEYDVLDSARFPNLRAKIVKALGVEGRTGSVWLTADQMAAFTVAAQTVNNPRRAPLVLHPGATIHDQILVTCGDHFAGMCTASSSIRQQPTRTKLRVVNPPAGDPIELWTKQLSTLEGETK